MCLNNSILIKGCWNFGTNEKLSHLCESHPIKNKTYLELMHILINFDQLVPKKFRNIQVQYDSAKRC